MADWLGYGGLPRPRLPAGAASALNSAIATVDAAVRTDPYAAAVTSTATALVQGQFVGPVSPNVYAEPTEVTMRCAGCRTNYGRITLYASGQIELFCTRSKCKRRTVIPVVGR